MVVSFLQVNGEASGQQEKPKGRGRGRGKSDIRPLGASANGCTGSSLSSATVLDSSVPLNIPLEPSATEPCASNSKIGLEVNNCQVIDKLSNVMSKCLSTTKTPVNRTCAKSTTIALPNGCREGKGQEKSAQALVLSQRSSREGEYYAVSQLDGKKYFAEAVENTRKSKDGKNQKIWKGKNESNNRRQRQKDDEIEEIIWTRPKALKSKKGESGLEITLQANYLRLVTLTDWCLYQYRVDFYPEEERTLMKRKMLQTFESKLGEAYIFDGTVLFTRNKLPQPMELYCKKIKSDLCQRITLRLVGDMAPGDHHYLQFYNLLVRRCLGNLNLQLVGRNYFDPGAAISSLSEYKLQLWPGYVTSVRQHENEVLMCAEVTHKVMRKDTVLDQLTECFSRFPNDFQRMFKKNILGCIVLTEYNNKTYRIDDVAFGLTPKSKFELRENVSISYMEYYKMRYDIAIKHLNQPLLLTMPKQKDRRRGMKQPIYLVPELCRMTGLSEQMRKNFPLMKSLADKTRLGPAERIKRLYDYAKRLQGEERTKAELERWNMKFSNELVTFNARVLRPEKIYQVSMPGEEVSYYPDQNSDWTKELRKHSMFVVGKMRNWILVSPSALLREAKTFVENVQNAASGMGLNFPYPKELTLEDDHLMTYTEALDRICRDGKPSLIMIIIPNSRMDRYAAIKTKCCVDYAVPTQLILAKNLTGPGNMSIATKVAVQINCKIGGAPWTVEIPLQGLMVVGFDVYHDTSQRGKSIGAIVASLNRPLTRYYSSVSYHRSGEELSNELSVNIIKALHKYKTYNNGHLPSKIIIYRDGVGEGQVTYVIQHEVEMLKKKLQAVYESTAYHMAFIIITKRINTRIFTEDRNPPSGTIVDDVITLPHRYDFFLVSQSVRQGTVSPTSYNVLFDNVGLTPDRLQRLTYKLCHLYFNWSGTVRVPAPCQYAHKLAYLVGQAINKTPNPDLDDLLYFL
ncbi:hypothetical protein J437_LFUL003187 [Ladona fulva]|uniref:Piwi n=1 Tax=Ladona fulva TaxID=123851 RepID=A0A8K0NYG7_LADFU|nr:hypothetical protein J437_LFUL003187 [Ladona fulva]